ncbi:MAG: glutamate synthase [Clostridia bacterium]|nr:glutamate synthase [Clostridia bacterium]
MILNAKELGYQKLNEVVREASEDVIINECCGERFIGCGAAGKNITINGIPGNALGAYLDGATITVNGNAQDAVGDTMNDGRIIVNGNVGDALGYAMRGGKILIKDNSGYRTGIHMKQYKEKCPIIVVGGRTGSFLGEYLAGGTIIVLGLNCETVPLGNFTGTGMHGGEIWVRSAKEIANLPAQVSAKKATKEELKRIKPYITEYAELFGIDEQIIYGVQFYLLKPNAKNPYKQLYTEN